MKDILIIAHFIMTASEKGNGRFTELADIICKKNKNCNVELLTTSFSHGTKEQRNIGKLGTIYRTDGDKEILLTPLHPINVSYQLMINNMIEDEEIFAIVKGARDIVEAGQNLIDRANENGGNDNISVVLAEPFSDEVSIW